MYAYNDARNEDTVRGFGLTISVGIYELVPTRDGSRMKRGKTVVRVRGDFFDRKTIFAKADEIVKELNTGTYTGKAVVDVR